MKKNILSAIACVAFAGSSFASNELVILKNEVGVDNENLLDVSNIFLISDFNKLGDCYISVSVYNRKGELIDSVTRKKVGITEDDCNEAHDKLHDVVVAEYPSSELTIESSSSFN